MSQVDPIKEEARRVVLESKALRHEIRTVLLALHDVAATYDSESQASRDTARELLKLSVEKLEMLVRS